jgi:hypothetical protein
MAAAYRRPPDECRFHRFFTAANEPNTLILYRWCKGIEKETSVLQTTAGFQIGAKPARSAVLPLLPDNRKTDRRFVLLLDNCLGHGPTRRDCCKQVFRRNEDLSRHMAALISHRNFAAKRRKTIIFER